jgi:Asp-tRNA(Asn)/Glu-tRNA(Gln) amidotransferase A subunit family amidase
MIEARARLSLLASSAKHNAFVHQRSADEVLSLVELQQTASSLLRGKLFGIKANLCVKGWPSDACSQMLSGYKSPFSATAVERIEQSGGVLVGLLFVFGSGICVIRVSDGLAD